MASTKNGKKKKGSNPNLDNRRRNERNGASAAKKMSPKAQRSPPKYKANGSQGSTSLSYEPMMSSSLPKSNGMRFGDQPLKRKRKQQGGSAALRGAHKKGVRPTFQFKIGMEVGVALGDCFLQLQRLENSMDTLRNVSEDITVVMQCINEQMGVFVYI